MMRKPDRKLVLPDGTEYCGFAFGAPLSGVRIFELVFNTSMAGYQEILSDPSYTGQAVVMSWPLIGNYGLAEADYESGSLTPGALIVREHNARPSNFRSVCALGEEMLRDARPRTDTVPSVSTKEPRRLGSGNARFHVAVIDCGVKENILREMLRLGAELTVLPWNTPADEILALKPDGVFISNGPGDPADVPETEEALRGIIGKVPVFGICLGHQLIARAMGASTYKLHFGHRGGNHPVKNLLTGKVEITSQNHSFAVNESTLPGTGLTVTHRNLLDNTVEGLRCAEKRVFCVQYHPESAPGPQDSKYLFREFFDLLEKSAPSAADAQERRNHAETH